MRSDECVKWLRQSAYIGDANQYPDQTAAVLFDELNHKLWSVFEDIVVTAREGYWRKPYMFNTAVGRGKYRIPPRAVVQGLEKVEIAPNIGGAYMPVKQIPSTSVPEWEGPISGNPGFPRVYVIDGDVVQFFPTPNVVVPVRFTYYLRPSKLVTSQSSTVVADGSDAVVRGQILFVTPSTGLIQVNVKPFDQFASPPAAYTAGVVDIVRPDGWHEVVIPNLTVTSGGADLYQVALPSIEDLNLIQPGDYVRVAGQTDWPCLPEDYQRCLSDVAAIKVAVELGLRQKGDELAKNVENDLVRFRSSLKPRVKSEPEETPVHLGSRGGGGSRWLP
jgi:hypothetical protein